MAILATAATILAVTSATIGQPSSDWPASGEAAGSDTQGAARPGEAAAPQSSQTAAQPHRVDATAQGVTSPEPHPLNAPRATPTPEPLSPPPVGPYRPKERTALPSDGQHQVEDFDVLTELGPTNLAAGTKRLIRDVGAGSVSAERATRISLAKMGYLPARDLPQRYRGAVTQTDYLALAYTVEVANQSLSDTQRERIAAEVDAHVHGGSAPTAP